MVILAEDLHTMSRILPIPRMLRRRWGLSPSTPKLFLIAKIPLLPDPWGASGLSNCTMIPEITTLSFVPHMASEQESWVPVREETFTYFVTKHHTKMLLRLLSEPAEGLAVRLPGAQLSCPLPQPGRILH